MTGQELKAVFGRNVKERRKMKKYSQEDLAEAIDVSANTISGIEAGKKFVAADTLAALSEVFGTAAYELFKPKHFLPDDKEGLIERLSEEVTNTLAKFIAG